MVTDAYLYSTTQHHIDVLIIYQTTWCHVLVSTRCHIPSILISLYTVLCFICTNKTLMMAVMLFVMGICVIFNLIQN